MTQKLDDFLVLLLIYFSNSAKINRLTTDFSRRNQLYGVIVMSNSYSWKLRTEKLGVTGNRLHLGLRKVTAARQLKATKPKIQPKTRW
jgi:hypothetical protein